MKGPLESDLKYLQGRPSVPGEPVEYVYLPSRGFMKGRAIKKGHVLRIINLEGKQCADCIIWDANHFENVLNCCMTMMLNKKWDKWQPGDVLYSKNCDKLAIITQDTTGGTHAALGAFCNEPYVRVTTGISGCPNCRDNLVSAMAAYGFSAKDLDWDSCITFFMSVLYNADGSIGRSEPKSKPGDHIDLMAEMDIVLAISNCPSERSPVAYSPAPLQVVIFDPNEDYKVKVKGLQK